MGMVVNLEMSGFPIFFLNEACGGSADAFWSQNMYWDAFIGRSVQGNFCLHASMSLCSFRHYVLVITT